MPESLFDERPTDLAALQPGSSFLSRCATAREEGDELEARLALGAYLLLRLIGRATNGEAPPGGDGERGDGFHWQHQSVHKFIHELPVVGCVEGAHLHGIVDAVDDLRRGEFRRLAISLLAYSWHLEEAGLIDDALEAVAVSAPLYEEACASDRMQFGMTAGRYQRTLARWDLADNGYQYALQAAEESHNVRGALLARLGRAKVLLGQGNLPESRRQIEQIISEANGSEQADAKAWAYADLAALLDKQDRPWESLHANYLAFQYFKDSHERARVLSCLGAGLRGVGALSAARSAFECVLRTTADWYLIANAKVELMAIGVENNDELTFRRYWQAAEEHAAKMAPSLAIDFRYRVGLGLGRFGKRLAARRWLIEARTLAETHGLNEWYFRLDALVNEISAGSELPMEAPKAIEASQLSSVGEIETGLRRYAEALAS